MKNYIFEADESFFEKFLASNVVSADENLIICVGGIYLHYMLRLFFPFLQTHVNRGLL